MGYNISEIRADPKKYPLFSKRSPQKTKIVLEFLRLIFYYQKLTLDFAVAAKPLSLLTRDKNPQTKTSQLKKVDIKLDGVALKAF